MSLPDARPKARAGLLVADHEKGGRRLITVLDRSRERVVLLEPWEHGVLVLSDGTRTVETIAGVIATGIGAVSLGDVVRCLEELEREGLIEPAGFRGADREPRLSPPGPKTLAGLQQAYREWHKDPVKTGQILLGALPEPFPEASGPPPTDLRPTMAVADGRPGEVAGLRSMPSFGDGRAFESQVGTGASTPLEVGATFIVGPDGRAARSLLTSFHRGRINERGARSSGLRDAPPPRLEAPLGVADGAVDEDPLDVVELLRAVDSDLSAFIDESAPPDRRFGADGFEGALADKGGPTALGLLGLEGRGSGSAPAEHRANDEDGDGAGADGRDAPSVERGAAHKPERLRAVGGEAMLPVGCDRRPAMTKVSITPPGHAPTVVGRAPSSPGGEPELLAPPRGEGPPADSEEPTLRGHLDAASALLLSRAAARASKAGAPARPGSAEPNAPTDSPDQAPDADPSTEAS